MTWTKTSDDYEDDCWALSDPAYRLHHDGLTWSNRKLLDCRIPKEDLHRFKRPQAIGELLERGFWEEDGDFYVIVHHAAYQRTAEQVIRMQDSRRANGAKGGRPKGPAREVWQGKATRKPSSKAPSTEPSQPDTTPQGEDPWAARAAETYAEASSEARGAGQGQDWPGQEGEPKKVKVPRQHEPSAPPPPGGVDLATGEVTGSYKPCTECRSTSGNCSCFDEPRTDCPWCGVGKTCTCPAAAPVR
jgi:hypothetical protein